MLTRILSFVKSYWHDLFVLGCILLIAVISYNLGRIQALEKTPLKIVEGADIYTSSSAAINGTSDGQAVQARISQAPRDPRVVVAKGSTSKKYHYSWCASGKRILLANQIWFETEAAAKAAGYTLAGNCQ